MSTPPRWKIACTLTALGIPACRRRTRANGSCIPEGLASIDCTVGAPNGGHQVARDIEAGIQLLHIDPWCLYKELDEGIEKTVDIIVELCGKEGSEGVKFEIGTEEASVLFAVQHDWSLRARTGDFNREQWDERRRWRRWRWYAAWKADLPTIVV